MTEIPLKNDFVSRRYRVHHSADNLMSLAFSESWWPSWWHPNWNMLNRWISYLKKKMKVKGTKESIETCVPVVSGETDKNQKVSDPTDWINVSYWRLKRRYVFFFTLN
jgi:hypothetical protein